MFRIATIIILVLISNFLFTQNNKFDIQEVYSTLEYELIVIDSSDFNNSESIHMESDRVEIIPMTEKDFVQEYPEIFKNPENGYTIQAISGSYGVRRYKSKYGHKGWTDYEFIGKYCNYALIFVTAYEDQRGYISVNLTDGIGYYTLNSPLTIDCNICLSYSNYYGPEEISLVNMNSKKSTCININNWNVIETRYFGSNYYLKLESSENFKIKNKYILFKLK